MSHFIQNIAHGVNHNLANRFTSLLPQTRNVIAEYVWIGGTGLDLRSKSRVLHTDKVEDVAELPSWSFDGSSTDQAVGHDSEVLLKPIKYVPDPFRLSNNILVLCECVDPKHEPIKTNRRAFARDIFSNEEVIAAEPWFGLEQEYTIFTADNYRPLGFPLMGQPAPQGQYYCAIGVDNAFGRHLAESHLFACLYAGLDITGNNAEVMPGSWEYQIGPTLGIDCADQLWLARYIMDRIAEEFQIKISLSPKPLSTGDWNGAGCHCNFSTASMRSKEKGGIEEITNVMKILENKHEEHMGLYGSGNELRMTGIHETAKFDEFTWAIANRGVSVRIPRATEAAECGFFEDRRPAANCDPYNVTGIMTKSVVLDGQSQKKAN